MNPNKALNVLEFTLITLYTSVLLCSWTWVELITYWSTWSL